MSVVSVEKVIEEIARRDTTDGTVKVFSGREIAEIICDVAEKELLEEAGEKLAEEMQNIKKACGKKWRLTD